MSATNGTRARAVGEIRDSFNRMRGQLFMSIEAVGLPDRQEDAFKGLVRQMTYQAQADLEAIIRRGD